MWVGVGEYSFSPDDLRAIKGQGVAFFLKDRQAPTHLSTKGEEKPFVEDEKTFFVGTGGVCYRRIKGKGKFLAGKVGDSASNDTMEGTINTLPGGGD